MKVVRLDTQIFELEETNQALLKLKHGEIIRASLLIL